jgi:hypothetical protein
MAERPLCGAFYARDGNTCQRKAVKNGTRCYRHGGQMQQQKTLRRQALKEVFGNKVPDVAPAEAMLQAVSWKYAEVAALRRKVAQLEEEDLIWGTTRRTLTAKDGDLIWDSEGDTVEEASQNIWWKVLHRAEDQLVRYSAAARAAGCDERRISLAEQQGALVAGVIRAVLEKLNLTPDQMSRVNEIVSTELRALSIGETSNQT